MIFFIEYIIIIRFFVTPITCIVIIIRLLINLYNIYIEILIKMKKKNIYICSLRINKSFIYFYISILTDCSVESSVEIFKSILNL